MDIPARLKALREARGLSLTDLAKASHVSQPYLGQIESGIKSNPSAAVLQRLATALRVTVADLIGAPVAISQESLEQTPEALRELVRKRGKAIGLRQEDIEMLRNINYRGKAPETVEDWELLFLFIKRLLQ